MTDPGADTKRLFEGPEIGLADMLAAREARVACRARALREYSLPTVTLTLVMPGAVKNCPTTRRIARAARAALPRRLETEGWSCLQVHSQDLPTGPETLYVVDADVRDLKTATASLEERHSLGRLWDLDVHGIDGLAISRRDLGMPARKCLICAAPAHSCARARKHSQADLFATIEHILEASHPEAGLALDGEGDKPKAGSGGNPEQPKRT